MVNLASPLHPAMAESGKPDDFVLNSKHLEHEINDFTAAQQANLFQRLKNQHFTGKIFLKTINGLESIFHFSWGRIIYGSGGVHCVRRWRRNLSLFCPQILSEIDQLSPEIIASKLSASVIGWQYALLDDWTKEQKISREQLNQVIRGIVNEILFDLTQAGQVFYRLSSEPTSAAPLILIDAEQVVTTTWKQWQQWQSAKLGDRSPNSAPIIKDSLGLQQKSSPQTFEILTKNLDGKTPLRDLALRLNPDILQLTRTIMLYVQMGFVALREVEDLPAPILACPIRRPSHFVTPFPVTPSTAKRQRDVVVCVDPNPLHCQSLKNIVMESNCDFVAIHQGLQAIAQLLLDPPDIMFLNANIADINGFDICQKLRQIDRFRQIPIIIFVDQINVFEKMRAKLVGASELIEKPFAVIQILGILVKYIDCDRNFA